MIILLSLLLMEINVGDVTILSASGDTLTLDVLTDQLAEYDVIFVGEQHDARAAHEAELAILTALAEGDSALTLGLEMFEADVQEVLDAYLAGEITEDTFLARSRPWPNYQADYRPLIEFAKSRSIPVVAANVPRRAAGAVARAGEVSRKALGTDSVYIPDTLHLDSDHYYQRFAATMAGMPNSGPMGGMNVDAFYKAQVLKDAVMAQSLHPYLDRRILFFCGRFHSDYHLGVPYQLARNHPDLKIAVITSSPASEELSDTDSIADFLWIYQ